MKLNTKPGDKVYRLRNSSPLSFILPSRSTKRFPLLHYDEKLNTNRPLRYAVNQKSPFEDEQDGNAIVDPVIFENGMLRVPKQNPVLQAFLHYHPMNGTVYEEVNYEKDAETEVQIIASEIDALVLAKSLDVNKLENVARVLFGIDPLNFTTAELKRDVMVFAKRNPEDFIDIVNDPTLEMEANVHRFFEEGLLTFRNNNKEVWYNTKSNKKKMINIPYGEDPYMTVSLFLKSDDGIDSLQLLENFLESE